MIIILKRNNWDSGENMKKWMKILLIILGIWVTIFLIDFVCVKTVNRPIFMIRTSIYKDGGTKEYYGLGYKVIKCNTLVGDKTINIGTYLMEYNCKTKIENENITLTDAAKFSQEYGIDKDNVFVYRDINEIINILDNGTGIVYLGFHECKWCKAYVPYLNEVAKENNLDKIYYLNILEDRKNNTDEYMEIVSLLKFYLKYDEEGKKRVYVPTVIAVKEGNIIGFDDETSLDTNGFIEPSDYWIDKEVSDLKKKLTKMVKEVNTFTCTDCNK